MKTCRRPPSGAVNATIFPSGDSDGNSSTPTKVVSRLTLWGPVDGAGEVILAEVNAPSAPAVPRAATPAPASIARRHRARPGLRPTDASARPEFDERVSRWNARSRQF